MMMLSNPRRLLRLATTGPVPAIAAGAVAGGAVQSLMSRFLVPVIGQAVGASPMLQRVAGFVLGLGSAGAAAWGLGMVPAFRDQRRELFGGAAVVTLLAGIVNFVEAKLGAAYYRPLADYGPRDAGGMFDAMSADYPVKAVPLAGEPGQYNTAAVGIWDEGFAGEEDLIVSTYN